MLTKPLSRRTALKGAIAATPLAICPIGFAGATTSSDAEIFAAISKLPALDEAKNRAHDLADAARWEAMERFPPVPEIFEGHPMSWICRGTQGPGSTVRLLSEKDAADFTDTEKGRALEEYEAGCGAVLATHGYPEAKEAADREDTVYWDAYDAIMNMPADTPAGMLAKLEMDPCTCDYPEEVKAVMDDLRRLAGRASS